MRIICKRPSLGKGGRPGVCAYDVISFRHHPADADPFITCSMADGRTVGINREGQDDGTLEGIVETLLSPSGVADCRDMQGISITITEPRVHIMNKSVPVTIEGGAVPVTLEDEVVSVTIEDEVVPVTIEDEVVPITVEDEAVPVAVVGNAVAVTVVDDSVPVYVVNQALHTVTLF